MPLSAGTRLGAYEIVSALGAGGMGEVYRARDAKLNRDVALKVLPELFACDPDRLARFKREAQVLASLNHPNIAAIYGFEESKGVQALVLELVEGPTLADRVAQGPIPIDDALPMARQIAEALEAAHEQGIIHRDLKPANIKVRPDGAVKVLDFGLAKALEPVEVVRGDVTASPTITSPALTQIGMILGTAAYLSPEQVKGRPADKRSDVWAFGAVLYEMLSGQRAFKGEDISDTLAAVLRQTIDLTGLPASTPPAVRRLVSRCLDRDVKRRLRDIGEARIALEDPTAAVFGDAAVTAACTKVVNSIEPCSVVDRGVVNSRVDRNRCDPRTSPESHRTGGQRDTVHDSATGQHVVCQSCGPWYWRHYASGGIAGWPQHRVRCSCTIRLPDLAAARRQSGRHATCRHRRRNVSILVARQPVRRVLRGRQTQEGRDRRWTAERPLRCGGRTRRELEPEQCHPVRADEARRPPARIERRWDADPCHDRRSRDWGRGQPSLAALSARWPALLLHRN